MVQVFEKRVYLQNMTEIFHLTLKILNLLPSPYSSVIHRAEDVRRRRQDDTAS